MKKTLLLLALFFQLTNMNAGGCTPWFIFSNPNSVQHTCSAASDTFRVVLNPLDSNFIVDLAHSGASCVGSSNAYFNLQWYKNGVPIAGNTHFSDAGAGVYSYTCAFTGVNNMTVTIIITNATATGIHQSNEINSGIHIFPNPSASGLFDLKNETVGSNYSINIYDLKGQLVKQQLLNQPSAVLDLSNYEKGIYFLEFTFANGIKSHQKVVYD